MDTENFALSPRDVPVAARSTCSDVDLDVHITSPETRDDRSALQRQIERQMALPTSASRAFLGPVEFYYADGVHLAGISFYGNLAAAEVDHDAPTHVDAAPVWLSFPDLANTDRDVVSYPASVQIRVNRAAGRVRLILDGRSARDFHALADRVFLGLDPEGKIAEVQVSDVMWG